MVHGFLSFQARGSHLKGIVAAAVLGLAVAACGGSAAPPTTVPTATLAPPTATPVPATPTRSAATATAAPVATPTAPTATAAPGVAPTATAASTPTPRPAPTATPVPTTTPTGPTPKYGGTWRGRFSGDWREWDSRANGQGSGTVSFTMTPVLNNLIVTPPADPSHFQGDLAESWDVSADGKTVTFKLRRDVKWHDGTQFTAKDATFTFDKYVTGDTAATFQKARLTAVAGFKAVDDFTFAATLKSPSASFLTILTAPQTLIYPAHVPFTTTRWTDKPVGTGPFRFDSYEAGSTFKYSRNPNYWRKDGAGRALPYLDGLQYFVIADRSLGQAAFESGRIEVLGLGGSDLPPNQVDPLKKRMPQAKVVLNPAGTPVDLQFNNRPPWDNLKLRQAIFTAIDYKLTNDAALEGKGYYPPSGLLPVGVGGQWALPEAEILNLPGYRNAKDQDVALAKRLLAESGINPSSLTLNIVVFNASPYTDAAAILVTELQKLGIKGAIQASATHQVEAARGNFDLYVTIYATSIDDPADAWLSRFVTGGAQNNGKWSFPDVDDLAQKQETELDPVKRRAILHQLQRRLSDLAYDTAWFYFGRGVAVQSYVEGFPLLIPFNQSNIQRNNDTWLNR